MRENSSIAYSIRSLAVIILFMAMFMTFIDTLLYVIVRQLSLGMTSGTDIRLVIPVVNTEIMIRELSDVTSNLNLLMDNFFSWVVPATAVVFLIAALALWLLMKLSLSSVFSGHPQSSAKRSPLKNKPETDETRLSEDKKDHADQRLEQERQRRLFLHFLSVLQREGRLLDFFSEDLTLYDDEQIGAAARSIQEDCKKAVEKYLAPSPVLNREEGEQIDIEKGFDPDAIKLTGNVSGHPPFKGILRHKGWKAVKKDIPKLSDVIDSSIIAPAEVEIQ